MVIGGGAPKLPPLDNNLPSRFIAQVAPAWDLINPQPSGVDLFKPPA